MATDDGRGADGRFVKGNPGGPGRPRRAVEADYLAALAEGVSLDVWRRIVARAAEDAAAGDGKAREWIARYVLGEPAPGALQTAAALAECGVDGEALTLAEARALVAVGQFGGGQSWDIGPRLTLAEAAVKHAVDAEQQAEAERQAEERRAAAEARKAQREAQRQAQQAQQAQQEGGGDG